MDNLTKQNPLETATAIAVTTSTPCLNNSKLGTLNYSLSSLPPPPPRGILKPHDPPLISKNASGLLGFGSLREGKSQLSSKLEWISSAKNAFSSTLSRFKSKSSNSSSPSQNISNDLPFSLKRNATYSAGDRYSTANQHHPLHQNDKFTSNNVSHQITTSSRSSSFYKSFKTTSNGQDVKYTLSSEDTLVSNPEMASHEPKFVISEETESEQDTLRRPQSAPKHVTFGEEHNLFHEYTDYSSYDSSNDDEQYNYNLRGNQQFISNGRYSQDFDADYFGALPAVKPYYNYDDECDLSDNLLDEKSSGSSFTKSSIFNAMSLIRRDTFSKRKEQQRKKNTEKIQQNHDLNYNQLTGPSADLPIEIEDLQKSQEQNNFYDSDNLQGNENSNCTPERSMPMSGHDVYMFYLSSCEKRNQEPIQKILQTYQNTNILPTTLNLTHSYIDSSNVHSLSDLLSLKIKIDRLILDDTNLDNDTLKLILYTLLNANQIPHLSLADNKKIHGNGFKYISVFIKKTDNLISLDLSGIPIDRKAASYLSHILSHVSETGEFFQSQIKSLKLDRCKLKSAQLDVMTSGILFSKLEHLSLRQNKISSDAGVSLAQILSPTSGSVFLKYLDLRSNELKHGLAMLSQAIVENKTLISLNLRDNKIDHDSFRTFANALKKNKCLENLDLSGNPLYDDEANGGIMALKAALIKNKTLKCLCLSNINLHSEGGIELAEGVPLYQSLEKLELSYNPLGVAGAIALSAALRLNFTLKELDLTPLLLNSKGGGFDEDPSLAQHLNNISIYLHRNKQIRPDYNPHEHSLAENLAATMKFTEPHDEENRDVVVNELDGAIENLNLLNDILQVSDNHKSVGITRSPSQEDLVESLFKQLQISVTEMIKLESSVPSPLQKRIQSFKFSLLEAFQNFHPERQESIETSAGHDFQPMNQANTNNYNKELPEIKPEDLNESNRHDESKYTLADDTKNHLDYTTQENLNVIRQGDSDHDDGLQDDTRSGRMVSNSPIFIGAKSSSSFSLGSVDQLINQVQEDHKKFFGDQSARDTQDQSVERQMQEIDMFLKENEEKST